MNWKIKTLFIIMAILGVLLTLQINDLFAGGFQEAVNSWKMIKKSYGEYHKMKPFDKDGNFQPNNIRIYMEDKNTTPSNQLKYTVGNLIKEERQKYRIGGSGAIASMPNYKLSPGLKSLFGLNGTAKNHKWEILDEGVDVISRQLNQTFKHTGTKHIAETNAQALDRLKATKKPQPRTASGKSWRDYDDPWDKRYVNSWVESPWEHRGKIVIGSVLVKGSNYEIDWFYLSKTSSVSSPGVRKENQESIYNLLHYETVKPVWMSSNDFRITHGSNWERNHAYPREPRILFNGKVRAKEFTSFKYLGDTPDEWTVHQGRKFTIPISEVINNTITLMVEKDMTADNKWEKRKRNFGGQEYMWVASEGRKKLIKNIIIKLKL